MLNELFGLDASANEEDLVNVLEKFVEGLDLPTSLSQIDIRLQDVDLDRIAEETTRMVLIHNNPRPATAADCRTILEQME
jgi:alcohol dehydrogenase class IV